MGSSWEEVKLIDLTIDNKAMYGISAPAVEFSNKLYAYLRITDINDNGTLNKSNFKSVDDDNAEKYLLKPNDIVFARTGASTGRNYFYDGFDGEFVFAGFLIKFSLDEKKVNPKYVKYYCQSNVFWDWVKSFNTGSTRGNINAKTFSNLDIRLPERNQQDLLVNTLSCLDEKIELNNKINANLEEQAQAIFREYSSNDKVLLSDCIKIKHGFAFKGEFITTEKSQNILVTPGNFSVGGGFQEKKCKFYVGDIPNNYILSGGDIIVTMTDLSKEGDTLGYSAIVPISKEHIYLHNQRIGLLEKTSDLLPLPFIYWFLRSTHYHYSILGSSTGTTVKHTSPNRITEQKIPLIKNNYYKEIELILKSIINKILSNQEENEKLKQLRDTLLPKLMNGEIDVDKVVV